MSPTTEGLAPMTINDTDETTQCAAFSSETAFLRQTAAQIEDGRAFADECRSTPNGGVGGDMHLMALMTQHEHGVSEGVPHAQ